MDFWTQETVHHSIKHLCMLKIGLWFVILQSKHLSQEKLKLHFTQGYLITLLTSFLG